MIIYHIIVFSIYIIMGLSDRLIIMFFHIIIAIWRCSPIQTDAYMDKQWLEHLYKLHTIYGY
jgi:hypothetical protein